MLWARSIFIPLFRVLQCPVQRSTESAQTTQETACTLSQSLMLTRSHSHVHVGKLASVAAYQVINFGDPVVN